MYKYNIKVYFERFIEVEANGIKEAEEKALKQVKAEIDKEKKIRFEVKENELPINWYKYANEEANDIINNYRDEIDEFINTEIGKNESDENEIFDKLYQEKDLIDWAHMAADNRFIYNSTDALIEALQCIDRLSEWEETDSGLFEGLKTIEEQINARATYTLSNAIYAKLEEQLKDLITEKVTDNIINLKK